jgi:hypothetical protein
MAKIFPSIQKASFSHFISSVAPGSWRQKVRTQERLISTSVYHREGGAKLALAGRGSIEERQLFF